MRGRSFNSLLSGARLGTVLRYARAHRCPCAEGDGEALQTCKVCRGRGRYYDQWSDGFRAGFLGQDSQTLMNMLKQMGGTADVGDAVLVVPSNAPCYASIGTHDRIQLVGATDIIEWTIAPGSALRLPPKATPISARVISADGESVQAVPFPPIGTDGRIAVAVSTTISFNVARLYEVSRELPRVRGFNDGNQPKKVALNRVDWTVR